MKIADHHAPLMFKKKRGIDQLWMTREIKIAIKESQENI